MGNACFRCGVSQPSGRTFCPDCRSTVDLDGTIESVTERSYWKFVAAYPFLAIGGMLLGVVLSDVGFTGLALAGLVLRILVFVGFFGFLWALYMDAAVIRQRTDVDWSPNKWEYVSYVTLCIFLAPIPFVLLWHFFRRYRHVGFGDRPG